jgi:PAS domain S-box-containing protein
LIEVHIGFADRFYRYSSLVKTSHRVQTTATSRKRRAMNVPSGLGDALLNSASDAVIATDREGRIVFWNPGAERIFGFTAADAADQSLDLIIPENLRARHWAGYRHAMETGTSRYGHGDLLSVPGLTKDGRRISVEFTIVKLRNAQQEVTGTVAVMRDVTKRFEEVRELRRLLAQAGKAGT